MAKQVKTYPLFNTENLEPLSVNPQFYGTEGSKYDAVSPIPLEEQRAQAQTGWDSFGNITGRLVGRAALGTIEGIGLVGYGLPKALATKNLNALFDNELTQGFKRLDEALISNTPFYQSEAERKASLFSKEYLLSTPFWGNLIGEGGGFVLSAMGSGAAIGKGINLTGKFARNLGIISTDAEKIRELANAAKSGEKIFDKFNDLRSSIKARDVASYYTQRVAGNMYEAGVEARSVKEQILDAKMKEFREKNPYGGEPDEATKIEWENIANKYSNTAFGLNLALLLIDGMNMGRFLKGYKETNRTVNALRKGALYAEKGTLGKAIDRTLPVLTGGLLEAAQEGGQFITEKMTTDLGKKQKSMNAAMDFNDYMISTIKGLEETFGSKEGQESMLAGFLLGAPFNIPSAINQGTVDKHGILGLSNFTSDKVFQNLLQYNHKAYTDNVGNQKEDYAANNSHLLHEDLKRNDFYNYVKSRDNAGRFQDVLDDINDLKKMDLEVFNQFAQEEYDDASRVNVLNDLEKQARYYQKTKSEIETTFSNHPNKEVLIEKSVLLNNLYERVKSLEGKLASSNAPELIRTKWATDRNSLLAQIAEEEMSLGEYLSQRRTVEEDILAEEEEAAKTELEEPVDEETTLDTKSYKKGDKVFYDGEEGFVENVEEEEDEDGTVRKKFTISTSSGQYKAYEDELDNDLDDEEDDEDNERDYDSGDFKGVSTADVVDENGKPLKWMSLDKEDPNAPFVNATTLGLNDFRKKEEGISENLRESELHKSLKVFADEADKVKSDIINNGDDYTYELEKEEDDEGNSQYNVYAKKGNKKTRVGYFLDFDEKYAGNGKDLKLTISEFFDKYFSKGTPESRSKAAIVKKITEAHEVLLSKEQADITPNVYLATRIKNTYKNLTLDNIMSSINANRWKVNGEFVVATYSQGNYVLIGDVSKENEDIFDEAIKQPYNKNSIGAQFIIMVKRPTKTGEVYNFINFKGAPVSDAIKNDFINRINDPKIDKNELVKELNNTFFLTGSKGMTLTSNGKKTNIPVHLFFDTDSKGKVVIKREAKFVDGKKPETEIPKKFTRSKLDPIQVLQKYGFERITGEQSRDLDYVKDRVVTNVDSKLWDSFFSFSHMSYLGKTPKATSLSKAKNSKKTTNKKADENSNEVIRIFEKEVLNNSSFIKGVTEKGKVVDLDSGEEFDYYYNEKKHGPYKKGNPLLKRISNVISSDINKTKKLVKSALDIGSKVDRIYRDFFNNELGKAADYDIVEERNNKQFSNLVSQLKELKNIFTRTGQKVYANNVVIYDDELGIAGTIDIVTIDKFGKIRIYDVKTMLGNQFESSYEGETETRKNGKPFSKYFSTLKGQSNHQKHSKQTSFYRMLLANTHGLVADELFIIPIEVSYKAGDTKTSRLNMLKKESGFRHRLTVLDTIEGIDGLEYSLNEEEVEEKVKSNKKTKKKAPTKTPTKGRKKRQEEEEEEEQEELEEEETAEEEQEEPTGQLGTVPASEFGIGNKVTVTTNSLFDDVEDHTTTDTLERSDDIPFKPYSEFTELEKQSIQQANSDIKRILNVEVRLENNPYNFGSFRDKIIYLASEAPKGTLWHEAFHAVFSILSPEEKRYVLKTAQTVFGQPTKEEILSLNKIYRDRGFNKSFEYLYDKVLEEKVADLFQEYMNNKPTTFFGRLFEKLKNLINYLIGRLDDMPFQAFFNKIYGGEYKNIKPFVTDYSAKPSSKISTSEKEMLLLQLTAYWANREKYYQDEGANFNSFIKVMLNKIRKGHDIKIREDMAKRKAILDSQLKGNVINQEKYNRDIDFIKKNLAEAYNSEMVNGEKIFYPKYLNKAYDDDIIAEVKDYNQFKEIDEKYKDDSEDEKEEFYNKSEFEKSIHVTPAGKAVRAAMKDMVIIDKYFEIRPLNVKGIINNLSFALNGLEREEILPKLQSLAIKENPEDETDFSKSIKVILEEYTDNLTFQRQFNTAFDRQFAKAGKVLHTRKTAESKNYLKIENGEDHVSQQLNDWKIEYNFNRKLDTAPKDLDMLLDSLGFVIQPETLKDKEGINLLNKLRKEVAAKIKNNDDSSIFKPKVSLAILEKLAAINIQFRDDLGELNFKNAKGEPQSSIINSSYIIKALNKANDHYLGELKDKWKIYIGSKFGGKASDYKGIDPKSYFLSNLALYVNQNFEGDSAPNFIVKQPSDKNTIFIVEGKIFTAKKAQDINEIYLKEKNRQLLQMDIIAKGIRDILADDSIQDKKAFFVEGYDFKPGTSLEDSLAVYDKVNKGEISRNDPSVPRFLKFQNIPFINNQTVALKDLDSVDYYENLIQSVEAEYAGPFSKIMKDYMITYTNINKIINLKDESEGAMENYLKNFLINQNINRMLVLSHISPDLNQFKNSTDITKRAAGELASGPNHYDISASEEENNFNFGIIPDRKKIFNSDVEDNATAETLDGQGFETAKERLNRLIRLGRASSKLSTKNINNDDLYIDYIILKAYIEDDRKTIQKYLSGGRWKGNSPLKVDKTVGYGNDFYMKTSIRPLTRYWSSDIVQPGSTITLSHKTKVAVEFDAKGKILRTEEKVYTETYQAVQDTDNGKWYLPKPGREFEWNLMNEMQRNNMAAVFSKSAIKKGAKKVAGYLETNPDNPVKNPARMTFTAGANTFSYKDYRLQQENPSDKEYTIDGSQAIQQNDAHLPLDYIPEGNPLTMAKIRERNDELINQVKIYQKDLYLQGFNTLTVEGKKYCAFVNYVIDAMDSSGSTDRIKEFFELDDKGNFKFSSSLPMIETKFESILMSYLNNNIARHKVPGDKYTLTSSEFYRPMRDENGNVLTTYEVDMAKKEGRVLNLDSSEELRAPSKDKDGFKYAEVVVTEEYLEHLGITIQDWVKLKNSEDKEDQAVFEKISTFYGYRIPTQAHHSMLPCKIVDFMPTHFGSTVILPAEVTKLSGADYDVDSLFSQRYSIYTTSNGKIRMADNSEESIRYSLKKNTLIREYLNEFYSDKRAEVEEIIYDLREELKVKQLVFRYNENAKITGKEIDEIELKIKELEKQLETLDDDALNELSNVLNINKDFNVNQVYNELLDNRMIILTSEKGRKLINTPAEDHFKNLYEDVISKSRNFNQEAEDDLVYSSYSMFFKEWIKIFGGKTSIGGSANITKNHAFLQKNEAFIIEDLEQLFNHTFSVDDIEELDIDINFDESSGEFYIKGKNILRPKSDTLSNFVSMSVDNATNQTLIKFNINDQNISEMSVLASLGFGRNRIAMLSLNPIIKNIGNRILIEDTLLSNKIPNKIKIIDNYLKKFDWIPTVELNDEDLINGLGENYEIVQEMLEMDESEIQEIDDLELQDLFIKQVNIARFYAKIAKITKDYYTVNSIINYNKKIGGNGYDISKILGSIEIINKEDFEIQNIQQNSFIQTVNGILHEMKGKLEQNLISYSPYAVDAVSSLVNSTTRSGSDPSAQEFQHTMRKDFIHFLAMRFLRYKYEAGDNRFLKFSLTDKEVITGEKVIELFEKVKYRIRKYPLGRLFEIIPPSSSYPFPRVGIETYSNIDPENERILIGNFEDMLNDPDPEIQDFIKIVYHHIASHDNFKYISGSIVSKIRPMYHAALNRAYKGSADEIGLEDLFGMRDVKGEKRTMQEFRVALSELFTGEKGTESVAYELVEEFGKFFFSDGRNALFLKNKNNLFDDNNTKPIKDKNNKVVGYTVFLEDSDIAPQFFKTITFPDQTNPYSSDRPITNIYVRKFIKKGKGGSKRMAIYERIMLPKDNEFTTKYYQLDFEDQIDLMNEGMRLAKLLEKPGSDILEGLRKVKTSRFVDDNLDKDPDEDEDFILTQLDMDEDDNDEEEYEPDVDEDEDENPEPLEDEEEDTPVFEDEDDDSNLTPEQIEKMLPPILRKVIEKGKKVTVSSQPSTNVKREYTPENITSLKPNEVFVFGANTAGGHGGGTAGLAQRGTTSSNYTALPIGTKGKWSEYGIVDKLMQGTEGKSFGIVTKAASISGTSLKIGPKRSVPLSRIEESINALIKTANENPNLKFLVTKFGTNMAGFSIQEMKSLLENKTLPDNIILPEEFEVRPTIQTSSTTKEIQKFLEKDFDRLLPEIQKMRGYKRINNREDFLNLPEEKQYSLIEKICNNL